MDKVRQEQRVVKVIYTIKEFLELVEQGEFDVKVLSKLVEQLSEGYKLNLLYMLSNEVQAYILVRDNELLELNKRDGAKYLEPKEHAKSLIAFMSKNGLSSDTISKAVEQMVEGYEQYVSIPLMEALKIEKLKATAGFINAVIVLIERAEKASKQQEEKYSQLQLALFYYYTQTVGELPVFERVGLTRKEGLKQEAIRWGVSPNALNNKLYWVQVAVNRLDKSQIKNIQSVIRLLREKGFQKAVALAEEELRRVKQKF